MAVSGRHEVLREVNEMTEHILETNFTCPHGTPMTLTVDTTPNGSDILLASQDGGFVVRTDGSGAWGPLEFHTDRTMSSSAVPDWVPITEFLSSWAVGDWGYVPAYRVWPDGKVEWRGVVKGPTKYTGTPIIEIPPEALPEQYVPMIGAANGEAGGTVRIDVNDPSAPGVIRLNPQTGAVRWSSLDLITYYKS